jgi:hypothetical protein
MSGNVAEMSILPADEASNVADSLMVRPAVAVIVP